MKCPYCGFEITEPSHFCAECGKDLTAPAPELSEAVFAAAETEPAAAVKEEPVFEPQAANTPAMESATGGTTTVYHGVLDKKPDKKSRWATVGVWGWIGIFLLLSIPLVNLIFLLIWSFGGAKRQVLQNFSRATLILTLVSVILAVIACILFFQYAPEIVESIDSMYTF